jgi:hypothetical protein
MSEVIQIPRRMVEEMYEACIKIEDIIETLEELMDEEGLERLKRKEEELKRGEYIDANPEEVEELLK